MIFFFTTSLDKAYKACRRDEADLAPLGEPETYLEFEPSICPTALTKRSAINCNKVDLSEEALYVNDPVFEKYTPVSFDIVNAVKKGIKHSGTVKEKIIKLL